jgi:AcrR family transcriptional regulator
MLEPGLKKRPQQARSVARVNAIVKATATILAEDGYENLTMAKVAAKAGVPIGTVYQFFPGKTDLVGELVVSFQGEIESFAERELTTALLEHDLAAFVNKLVQGVADIQREQSAFVCVFAGSQTDPAFEALAATLRRALTGRLSTLFAGAFPNVSAEDRERLLLTWSDITRALISSLGKGDPSQRETLITELKIALTAYAEAKLGLQLLRK